MTLYLVTDERSTANTHIVISLQTLSTIATQNLLPFTTNLKDRFLHKNCHPS
jgi:hypothetical protein